MRGRLCLPSHSHARARARAGLFKLAPLFPHDPAALSAASRAPSSFADAALRGAALAPGAGGRLAEGSLSLPCPAVDYVEPELISLLITDTGGYTPSYIYRLLSEYYSREDYALGRGQAA